MSDVTWEQAEIMSAMAEWAEAFAVVQSRSGRWITAEVDYHRVAIYLARLGGTRWGYAWADGDEPSTVHLCVKLGVNEYVAAVPLTDAQGAWRQLQRGVASRDRTMPAPWLPSR